MKQKAAEQGQAKRVRVPGLLEFLAEVGSKTSDAESPRFEDVGGGEAAPEATSGAGKAPLEEEEEEKDRDTHFKRKRKMPEPKEPTRKEANQKEPRKKQVAKRASRDTQKASTLAASESVAEVPPPLIIKLPSRKETPKEPAHVPGKLDSFYIIFLYLLFLLL